MIEESGAYNDNAHCPPKGVSKLVPNTETNSASPHIAATGTRLLVVDIAYDKVYVYGHDGTRYPDEDMKLTLGGTDDT